MESGTLGDEINPWGVELFRTFRTVQPQTPSEEAAYGKWIDQTSDREAARIDRIHGAVGVIPTPLWVVLLLISGVVFVFMLFFADRGEGAVTQAVLMGSVATVVVSMLLLIGFLDSPFHEGVGGVRPVAMERTLRIIDEALQAVGARVECPATLAGTRLVTASAQAGLGRGRRHGSARGRGGRDRLEQLSGHALERRAGEDGGQREQDPDRGGSRLGPGERPAAGRRGDVHAVGGLVCAWRGRARDASIASASARSSSLRSRRGSRRSRSRPRALR